MSKQGPIGDLFRVQLKMERLRRMMTQGDLATAIRKQSDIQIYPSTIGKIEAGERDVRVDELFAFSGLFGISVDALLGGRGSGADALWAAEKLSSNASKMANDMFAFREKIDGDIQTLEECAERDKRFEAVADLCAAALAARMQIDNARIALSAVAGEFPLPGMK